MSKNIAKRQDSQVENIEQTRWRKPACDVYENENEWLITADIPGVNQDALRLHLDGSELTIEGRTKSYEDRPSYDGFRRSFSVPAGIDTGKVSAKLHSGVVAVHLPKSEAIKPRRIAVQAG